MQCNHEHISVLARNAALLRRKNGRFIRKQEVRLQRKLRSFWTKQLNWTIRNMRDLDIFGPDEECAKLVENMSKTLETNGIGDIDPFLGEMPYHDEIAVSIVSSQSATMDKGGKTVVAELKLKQFGVSWSLQNANAIRFLNNKRNLELSNQQGNIKYTTKQRIKQILVEAAQTGQSYEKTAQLIRQQGKEGVFSQARATMIATRELGVAYEEGNAIPLREFRLSHPDRPVEKAWQTVGDDRVTAPHRENEDAGWIGFESTFPGTGDMNAPGSDNPRCRCFTKYRILPPS